MGNVAGKVTKQRILVTGGLGFIGSNFIRQRLQSRPQDDIVNFDLMTYAANPDNLREMGPDANHRFIKGDIADPKTVPKAMKDVDAVVHFAAESHVDRSIRDAAAFLHTNVVGTQVLLDAARAADVSRFHHVSTDEVFGELPLKGGKKFDETTPYAPRSPYSASKAASDHLVRAWGHTYGLPFTISNGSNNYGPYQFPEKVIPRFVTNLIDGKKLPIFGTGKNVRDWLHVEDYCSAIDLILAKGRVGETYCVSAQEELDNLTLAKRIANAFGKGEESIEFVEDRMGHDLRYAIDSTKIRRELGWKPSRSFAQGLSETIEWYRENEAWWRPLKARAEAIYR